VAEDAEGGRLAYLLAVPLSAPKGSMFIWQLASREGEVSEAVLVLVRGLKRICDEQHVTSLFFTSDPDSAGFRAIRRYVQTVFDTEPVRTSALHAVIAPGEVEFRVKLR
jgi:hypothetical protein